MLTEAGVFPYVAASSPSAFAKLSLQERVRVRLSPMWLTAEDCISVRPNPAEKPADDIDKAQSQCQSRWG